MTFHSILFQGTKDSTKKETPEAPVCFADLHLDQVVDAVTTGREEYQIKPFFYISLHDLDAITYRQDIFRDLEHPILFEKIKSFTQQMRAVRDHLSQVNKMYYKRQKEGWFLDAVGIFCDAVQRLTRDLSLADVQSRGLQAFRAYVMDYAESDPFTSLLAETKKLKADLAAVQYCLLLKDNSITVRKYEAETDYSAEVEKTFEKFKQGAVKDYRVKFSTWSEMNHVEAQILDFVAQLHPDIFSQLEEYCAKNGDFLDDTLAAFDREIQFYLAYLEYIATSKQAGLPFCYPCLSHTCKEVYDYGGFDVALAHKLTHEHSSVVCNDFSLQGPERTLVVTGPNQGGKTTFARTFGQVHYLASLGCPVPGREAQLFLFDHLFTHFEKEENIKDLRGKLEDDLVRMRAILNQATPNSILIINEIFTSTTVQDAVVLSRKIMGEISQLDTLCVCVTFIDELASFNEKTVSMVSTVVPENPSVRTFRIVRRPADGLAYALAIAEKYQLTYECIKERLKS
jgi:hypothetical protein